MSNFAQVMPGPKIALTKSDSTAIAVAAIFVGTGGNVQVSDLFGNVVVYKNVPSGSYIWGPFARLWSTNTTASDFIGDGSLG